MKNRFAPHAATALLALFTVILPHAVQAGPPQVVTTSADVLNGGDGVLSLREAIIAANTNGGPTTISFDAVAFPVPGPTTIQLDAVLPDLTSDITITGPGANVLTVRGEGDSGDYYRIFNITPGQTVSISAVTIHNGRAAGANGLDGTATPTLPTNGVIGQGGGIFNGGTLTLTDCVLSSNTAQGGSGGLGTPNTNQVGGVGANGQGGAIYSTGPALTIVRCTFSGNIAQGGGGGSGGSIQFIGGDSGNGGNAADAAGGAIYLAGAGTHTIANSTFVTNSANGGYGGSGGSSNFTNGAPRPAGVGGDAAGGAIYSAQAVSLISCTVMGCAANAGNGGLEGINYTNAAAGDAFGGGLNASGTITIGNTLIASNTVSNPGSGLAQGQDVFGGFVTQNFNLIGALDGSATGINGATDQSGTPGTPLDAKLELSGALNNGGATPTVRLRKNSPAVDKGKDLTASGVDQRGLPRPILLADAQYPDASGGDGSDIGAFEAQFLPNDVPTTSNQSFSGPANTPFSQQLAASDADGDTLSFSEVSGTMPAGLTLNSNGSITGTPTAPVQTVVTFKVNDGAADSAPATVTLNISEAPSLVVSTDIDNSTMYDGLTSFREAINYAAGDGTSNPVTFNPTFFATPKTITLTNGGLSVTGGDLTILGAPAGVTLSGGDATVLFQVYSFSPVTLNLSNLTLAHFHNTPYQSGNVMVIYNFGTPPTVVFSHCTLKENGGDDTSGGAIANIGGDLTILNCTMVGNHADYVSNTDSAGGAIYQQSGSLTIYNSTITGNHSTAGRGGAIDIFGGTVTIGNSIVAGNSAAVGPDIAGSVSSSGYNIFGDTTGLTITGTTTGNQLNAAPGLDPAGLGYHTGPTETIGLAPGSLAIDQGKAFGGATSDQRGFPRPYDHPSISNASGGDGSDIGAFEESTPINTNPVATADTLERTSTQGAKIQVTKLLVNDTDADSDALTLSSVQAALPAGATVTRTGNWVYYTPPTASTAPGSFTYSISDGHGGSATGTVTVTIKVDNSVTLNVTKTQLEDTGGGVNQMRLSFLGIPNRTYQVQYTDSLTPTNWQPLGTPVMADTKGNYQVIDPPPLPPSRFYRSVVP